MSYSVFYHSAGCLPDSEPMFFDTLREAATYIFHERQESRGYLAGEGINSFCVTQEDIRDDMGADDPRTDSLYRWTIEENPKCAECSSGHWETSPMAGTPIFVHADGTREVYRECEVCE